MDFISAVDLEVYKWVILPILIFVSRIFDVSIGTMRIIFVSRGKKYIAPILGFFEILIWISAMGQIMQNINNIGYYLVYAGGFATGSFVGMIIEEKLALGMLVVRAILPKGSDLREQLSGEGYGVTTVDAYGANGEVEIVYTVIKRKDLKDVMQIINSCSSKAFISVEDARAVSQGIFPSGKLRFGFGGQSWFKRNVKMNHFRKGK
ncbi:MAG: DUF2179 domain-containing protein [Acetivibrionales bacterium]|jgi:uncharacterized protein YebE (UPF0316 family)